MPKVILVCPKGHSLSTVKKQQQKKPSFAANVKTVKKTDNILIFYENNFVT